MIVLSLFDGCGMAYQALKNLGVKVDKYYSSEIDKYAIQIAKKNHPDIVELGDINRWKEWEIERPDLIIGGFPCQSFSISGKRLNFEDPRGQLFFITLKVLEHYKPKYFLLENVSSMKKAIKDKISGLLGVDPIKINSALVSAQQRNRYYWTNIQNIGQPEDKAILLKDILQENVNEKYYLSEKVKSRLKLGHLQHCGVAGYKMSGRERDKATALLSRDYKGMQSRDFNVVIDKPIRVGSINKGGQGDRVYDIDGKSVSLSALGGGRGAKTGLYLTSQHNIIPGAIRGRYNIEGKTEQNLELRKDEKTNTLTTVQKDNVLIDISELKIRKLTPIECERLQTLPDNYTDGVSDSQRYKMLGNGFTVKVIEHILKNMK